VIKQIFNAVLYPVTALQPLVLALRSEDDEANCYRIRAVVEMHELAPIGRSCTLDRAGDVVRRFCMPGNQFVRCEGLVNIYIVSPTI
jgi:hypothetical protein